MRREDKAFVRWMLAKFNVGDVDDIKREFVRREHISRMLQFLSKEADALISRLLSEANHNKQPIYMSADCRDFIESGLGAITRSARIIICRIFGAKGIEIEFTNHGILVSPHRKVIERQKRLQPA